MAPVTNSIPVSYIIIKNDGTCITRQILEKNGDKTTPFHIITTLYLCAIFFLTFKHLHPTIPNFIVKY